MKFSLRAFVILAASGALALTSCTAPLSVDIVPAPRPAAVANDASTLRKAARTSRSNPLESAGFTLDALRLATQRVEAGDQSAVPEYNFLLARLTEHLFKARIKPWQDEVEVPSQTTKYIVRGTQPKDLQETQRIFVPTDRMEFSGRYASTAGKVDGLGAPLVAFIEVPIHERNMYSDVVRYRDVTAIIRFEGNHAVVDLMDPFQVNTVTMGKTRYRLAADFGAGASYALSKERIDKLGLARLFNPGKYDDTAYLGRFQPYDPDRIPVVMVHGLMDTPATWAPMFFSLVSDPRIRSKYQFWGFSYPSGYPYPMPASHLRKELERMRKLHPNHEEIVFIGHSMGGLISRLMVTDVGDGIWREFFDAAPAETNLKGENRALIEDSLVFDAQDDVSRAIFLSAPHRGSTLATNRIGQLGTRLIRLPSTFADLRDNVVNAVENDELAKAMDQAPNSIETLSPDSPFVLAINRYPIRSQIPFHTIAGDRGKKQPKEETSDGVVEYWSSHLDGATSEKLVPSDHSSHQHPDGIEEVRRILYLHAGIPHRDNP